MKTFSWTRAFQLALPLFFQGKYTLSFDQLEFPLRHLPLRKRLNLLVQGLQINIRPGSRIGIPPILQIEPTNTCNLRCLTCAVGADIMERPSTIMSFDMFQNIIDQVKDSVCFLAFWSWGEPFINKEACRMIRYAKDQGIIVHTSTNGHFFTTRERARDVIHSGLDSLIFAVDGLDQATYEKYRKNGDLQRVMTSIENLVAERKALGAHHPLIIFRFIVMKHNEHQVAQVKNFAQRLGVDLVTYRSAVVQRSGKIDLENDLTPNSAEYQQYDYDGVPQSTHRVKHQSFSCHRPYANLTIFSNGEVVPCENDFNATSSFGNVMQQSLRDILSSPRANAFLRGFRNNPDQYTFCRTCEFHDIKHETANVETHILNREYYEHTRGY
ncbi:MAG: radical SAM protein [Candidatus Vecturithrix sp.]|jgi:radical SAM protein with 4Fe4S-binding SPASM domain|nr:radical SAM protein [Candidatus Vecturithrix sp.]